MRTRQELFRRGFPWSRKSLPLDDSVFVKGEKVILREKCLEDTPADYAWRTDKELARLDATIPLKMSYAGFLKFSREETSFPSTRSKRLAIDTLEGRHIGNCMYYDIDVKREEAELGVMIGDRNYWSKGYGSDSVSTLLNHVFTTTPLRRIYLHTLVWNERARRSFAKTGFREVKTVRHNGKQFILMEVWRSEWEQDKSTADGAEF